MTDQEYEHFVQEIKEKAEAGSAKHQYLYALTFNNLSDPDYDKYFYYLEKAAKQGVNPALFTLAYRYYYGDYIDRDEKKAREYCKRAIEITDGVDFVAKENRAYRRFYDYMNRMVPDNPSEIYKELYRALTAKNWNIIDPLLDDDVILLRSLNPTITGKRDVLSHLNGAMKARPNLAVLYRQTERYGTVVELYAKQDIITMIFLHVNGNNKIDRIAFQPIKFDIDAHMNGCFCNAGSNPLPWKQIKPLLKEPLQKTCHKLGSMFCMNCGKTSDNLLWYEIETKIDDWIAPQYGLISVCPDCQQMVEFRPQYKRKSNK